MKNIKRKIIIGSALFVALWTTQSARAWYDPSTGRWLTRDPIGEPGFQVLRRAATTPQPEGALSSPTRWIHRDSRENENRYLFVLNDPVNEIDYLGLATVPEGTCADAKPLKNDSSECDKYGDKLYLGASLKCFCKCAPNDDWSQKVRGCLRCMTEKGYSDKESHKYCYALADKEFKDKKPTGALAKCWAKCLPCEVPEGWPPPW
jgi:hypothetical protein